MNKERADDILQIVSDAGIRGLGFDEFLEPANKIDLLSSVREGLGNNRIRVLFLRPAEIG